MILLGVPMTALNVSIGLSVVLIVAAIEIDRTAQLQGTHSDCICTLLVIVNLLGLWLGIFLQKVLK